MVQVTDLMADMVEDTADMVEDMADMVFAYLNYSLRFKLIYGFIPIQVPESDMAQVLVLMVEDTVY